MSDPVFVHLSTKEIANYIHQARTRVLLFMHGVTQSVAAAAVNTSKRLGRSAVVVVLDVDENVARQGYGEFDAVTLLIEGGVDVRVESGLRSCVLVVDDVGYAFFSPPMLIETQDESSVGINALKLIPPQVEVVSAALCPPSRHTPQDSSAFTPQVGSESVRTEQVEAVRAALNVNPPQKFDLARKVNVFNAFIEFVELRLVGLQIGRNTVQLPKGLGLALRDDATAKRLLMTFKLVSPDSKVAKEAVAIDKKVRKLREVYTRSLGESLGNVMLRSKRQELESAIESLKKEISDFQKKVVERLDREIGQSRKKLVEGLWQSVKRAKPAELEAQVSGPITSDVVKRYVDMELGQVFPAAQNLVNEMRLELVVKGVTYDVLTNPEFQERVRRAFPLENFDKPFREFEAAPSIQFSLFSGGNL